MHSNFNSNYNNNYSSLHLPDNGFQYFINGMQLLSPKWTENNDDGGGGGEPPGPISLPPHATIAQSKNKFAISGGGGTKAAIFQTASNAESESAQYCNMFLQSQYELDHRQQQALERDKIQQHQGHHNYQKQQQRSKHFFRNPSQAAQHHTKHSPPPFVHHHAAAQQKDNSNRNTATTQDNNNKQQQHHHRSDAEHHHRRQQQQLHSASSQRSESPDSAVKRLSPDQHYQHYYSYYYNRQPDHLQSEQQQQRVVLTTTSRKLPTTQMATGGGGGGVGSRNVLLFEDAANLSRGGQNTKKKNTNSKYLPTNNPAYLTELEENNRGVKQQHHVLKEKITNNNINGGGGYDKSDWMAQLNDVEVMNVITSEYIDAKDIETSGYDNKMSEAVKDTRLYVMQDTKRPNVRPRPNSESRDMTSNNTWIPTALNNNCQYQQLQQRRDSAEDAHGAMPVRQVKLPATPKRIKVSDLHIDNNISGAANGKKHSPPVHRVLLYSSQSPRLPRVTPSAACLQELRRSRNKSPALSTRGDQETCNRTVETNKGQNINCQVNVLKTLSPAPQKTMEKNSNPKIRPLNDANDNRRAGGSDNNFGNDVDDNDAVSSDDDFDDLDNVSNYGSGDSASSSDSEDGYRSHAYMLTHSMDRVAATQSYLSSQTSEDSLTNPESLLVPSLFPNVPPYLAFSSNTRKGPDVPPELYRVLKWRVTNVMPKVVRCVLANSGMRMLKKTNDWMGVWGKHLKSPCFKTIRPYQKINHLPGSFKIGRKDACWRNLQKQMNKHGKKDFGFMPKTYIIPHDLNVLRKNWPKYSQRNVKWIIKPPASARGAGIRVVNRWAQIPKRKPLIVQRYIERPLLINGSKFDLRLYVLVTSVNPLRVFMYHNGLARFASIKYSDKADTLNDRCMHLTNYSINKFSSNYSKNEDVNACHGHKWTIKSLWTYLANRGIRTDILWDALRNLVLRTILAGENSINNTMKINMESKYSCFELFGFDVLLDSDLIPWLLEVNISPSLHSELPLDAHVKAPLVQAVLNTALFNVPPKLSLESQKEIAAEMSLPAGAPFCYDKRMYINYLSRAEKMKHNQFTRKTMEDRDEYINSILDNLTPDDIRCLIVAEDELARCAPLERIFPTNQTHKYLKYNETPRYYNRLLDAWESRYGHNRGKGIALLREYCEEKYHLEVPPSPAKKHPKNRTRTLMMTRRSSGLALTTASRISLVKWRRCRRLRVTSTCDDDDDNEGEFGDADDDDKKEKNDENSHDDSDDDDDNDKEEETGATAKQQAE